MNPILKLYDAFAVPLDYDGPLAEEFHRMVARKYLGGMRGGHSSVVAGTTSEKLVREHLSIDWQIEHGTVPRHRHFMPEIKWHDFRLSVLRDRWSTFMASIRNSLKTNPYT